MPEAITDGRWLGTDPAGIETGDAKNVLLFGVFLAPPVSLSYLLTMTVTVRDQLPERIVR